jgi:DNA-binding beta-propeller fold protein YncE
VDDQGRIYVSDTGGFFVNVYDAEGNFIRQIGELGIEPGRFALPKGIAVDREHRIYVVDAATAVVQVFDPEGRLLMYFGYPKSSGPGGLYLPAGIAINYDHIPFFEKFAAPGAKLEFVIFITNQAGLQKVSAYGFMSKK